MRIVVLLALLAAPAAVAQTRSTSTGPARPVIVITPDYAFNVSMAKGEAQLLRTATPYANLVIGDPKVIAANPFGDRTLSIQAMEPGLSTVMFLDGDNNILGEVRVVVGQRGGGPRVVQTLRRAPPARPEHLVTVRAGNWGPLSLIRPAELACDWETGACHGLTRGPPILAAPAAAPPRPRNEGAGREPPPPPP